MRNIVRVAALLSFLGSWAGGAGGGEAPDRPWRPLPLIQDGRVAPDWTHLGWGGFAVEGDSLRTDNDENGMGLLLYTGERLGECQIRVVFKAKTPAANAGVFVRIGDGILKGKGRQRPDPVRRDKNGKLSDAELQKLKEASAQEVGPWYAVHHGYEVQICDDADAYHRTGAVYSLAKAAPAPRRDAGLWRTMIITLKGDQVLVDVDGQRVTRFDPDGRDVPPRSQWYEPKREPQRPRSGYIGLQNHDPGDVVWFKEVSVRPLDKTP